MSYHWNSLGQTEDPCGKQVDIEIALLEQYTALKKNPTIPPHVIESVRLSYESAKKAREECRRTNGMQVQIVVEPGKTQQETIQNLTAEAEKREAAGDTQAAQQLRQTVAEVKAIPVPSTSTFNTIASGIASALSPLSKLSISAPKRDLRLTPGMQPIVIQRQQGNNTPLIIGAIVGGSALVALLLMLARRS